MRRYKIQVKNKQYTLDVDEIDANNFRVILGDQTFDVNLSSAEDIAAAAITPAIVPGGARDEVAIERPASSYQPPAIETMERTRNIPSPALPPAPQLNGARADLIAPMPGTILSVEVKPGDAVTRGQKLLTLEAMKMKNAIKAPYDAVVAQVLAQPGQTVRYGDVLICFEESQG
ncbi:MAG: acetyl-CoA carboxylase biotin carboxyl carrier protein subunit [Chloroflexi bacterium]|nr:acetyl-CoA carboxylase biotin carboxyl carrier protein subunit [Chloroflexota bacterium]